MSEEAKRASKRARGLVNQKSAFARCCSGLPASIAPPVLRSTLRCAAAAANGSRIKWLNCLHAETTMAAAAAAAATTLTLRTTMTTTTTTTTAGRGRGRRFAFSSFACSFSSSLLESQ